MNFVADSVLWSVILFFSFFSKKSDPDKMAHPKRYLARAISYRECRLPDYYNPHALFNFDNITDYSTIRPELGDPAGKSLEYDYFPTWYSGKFLLKGHSIIDKLFLSVGFQVFVNNELGLTY